GRRGGPAGGRGTEAPSRRTSPALSSPQHPLPPSKEREQRFRVRPPRLQPQQIRTPLAKPSLERPVELQCPAAESLPHRQVARVHPPPSAALRVPQRHHS